MFSRLGNALGNAVGNAVGSERGNERGNERDDERGDETGDGSGGERGDEDHRPIDMAGVAGRSEPEDVNASASPADVGRDLGGKVAELERKVQDLENRLAEATSSSSAELERRVTQLETHLPKAHLPKAASSNAANPDAGELEEGALALTPKTPNKQTNKRTSEINKAADEAFYDLSVSMWDAGVLLFVHPFDRFDRMSLVVGVLMNLTLLIFFFVVIVYNLLDNDFNAVTVQEMLRWRVTHGHHSDHFDATEGQTLVRKLCEQELWSYEGKEYEEMYNYLFRAVPGACLSTLAIILWVLATVAEYRKCTSQFLALYHLKEPKGEEECVVGTDDGEDIFIVRIGKRARIATFVFLVLPRLVVALALMLVGSKYLAQTVTLSDIVLNTVALAFVMDVDEHVAGVVLSERVQHILRRVKPISCGEPNPKYSRVRDTLRYVLIFFMILFAIGYWIVPFVGNVNAAASALCGGELDFSYSGGTARNPDITIMPDRFFFDEYQAECRESTNQTYQRRYYPQFMQQNDSDPVAANASRNWPQEQMLQVLRHAFSADNCGSGRIRGPPKDTELTRRSGMDQVFDSDGGRVRGTFMDGECEELWTNFRRAMPDGVRPGEDPIPEECGRFNVSLHERACIEPAHPGVCLWSWEAQTCEGTGHPGVFFQSACRSSLWQECETWENGFNTSHPSKNCEVAWHCSPESPRCLQMDGWFEITLSDEYGYTANASYVRGVVSNAWEAAFDGKNAWVAAHFYAAVVPSPCRCAAAWSYTEHDASCADQAGCPVPACDGEPDPWCIVSNPGCQDITGALKGSVARCRPDCGSTDGVEATEFQCACGGATCEAGASCVSETSTCVTTPGPTTVMTTTTVSNPCQCEDVWDDSYYNPACVDQVGCQVPTCDGDVPWCRVTNPGCTDIRGIAVSSWGYCDPGGDDTATTPAARCIDIQMDALDSEENGCDSYFADSRQCGRHDIGRFFARALCCACGGGIPGDRNVAACADPREGCVLMFYRLNGVSEDLLLAEVFGANESIADYVDAFIENANANLNNSASANLSNSTNANLSNSTPEGSLITVKQVRFNETSVTYTAVES